MSTTQNTRLAEAYGSCVMTCSTRVVNGAIPVFGEQCPADGVINLAFSRDYSNSDALAQAVAQESAALAALGEELIGSDRPIVTVSGTPWVPGRPSTEADPLPTDGPVGGRGRSVSALLELASRGLRSSAVRMPRTVHNEGKGGFASLLTDQARRTGIAGP